MEVTEDSLYFTLVREGTPQWSVSCEALAGMEVALVTERVMASPQFMIRWPDETETPAEDRVAVVRLILERVNRNEKNAVE